MSPLPQVDLQNRLGVGDILPVIWRNIWVVSAVALAALLVSVVGTLMIPPLYRATAVVQITPSLPQSFKVDEVMDLDVRGYQEVERFYRTQVQLLRSNDIAEAVVHKYVAMGFDDFDPELPGTSRRLASMIEAVPRDRSQLVNISITHREPEKAAILANLVAQEYRAKSLERRQEAAIEARQWLEERLVSVVERGDEATRKLLEYTAESNLADIDSQANSLVVKIGALDTAYGEVMRDRVLLSARLDRLEGLFRQGSVQTLASSLDSPGVVSLASLRSRARAHFAEVAASRGPKHPDYLAAQAQLDRIDEQVTKEIRTTLDAERARLALLEQQLEELDEAREAAKAQLLDRLGAESRHRELKRAVEEATATAAALSRRSTELELAAKTQLSNISVVDSATIPKRPFWPSVPLNAMVGLVLGLGAGVLFALARAYIDDTIHGPGDIELYIKQPMLGVLPRTVISTEYKPELVCHFEPRSPIAEAMRGVRTMINHGSGDHRLKRLLVTSSNAGEGKTSTSVKLATVFAQQGRRVVLIEADHRRARLHRIFDVGGELGITDYLKEVAPLEDCIVQTPVPGVMVMPVGSSRGGTTELLSTERMEDLLVELDRRFDRIIIDTPPSAALSDGIAISSLVDGVLLVVRAERVGRALVRHTLQRLEAVHANVLGVILNDVRDDRWAFGGRYMYRYKNYYYYREAYEDQEEEDEPEKSRAGLP